MKHLLWILLLVVVVDAGKSKDASLSQRFNRGVQNLYRRSEALQEKAYKRIYDLQERAEDIQTKALKKAEQLEKHAESLLDRATRQAQDLQRDAATQLGELQATIENLPIGSERTESTEDTETIVGSISQRFSGVVEELYQKAERLQDNAYKRVRELQEQAEAIQAVSLKKAEQLEKQAESLLDRATREAKELQREAAAQLGALQATIEGHSIPPPPPPPPLEGTVQSSLPVIEDVSESLDDTTIQDISTPEQSGHAVEAILVETTTQDIATQSGYAPPMKEYTRPLEGYAPPPKEAVQVAFVAPSSKWNNVRERTLPAVFMLGALSAYIRFCGNMIPLIFLIQVGLYAEATAVTNVKGWKKWWWFLAAIAATNGHFLQWNYSEVIAYGMAATGLVAWVIQQNLAGTVEAFRSNLAKLAATHLSLLILVGQSSFWIATFQDYGLTWILYPAFLVMINDTMAYVFGMLMGKHPLVPIISPKKTWEGFVGATLSTLAVSQPLLKQMDSSGNWQHALIVSTFISLVSPFGGFLASVVKRAHGKKDFATWIPGHGGVVDRLDCQVMTAPFVYLYLKYVMQKTAEGATEALTSSV